VTRVTRSNVLTKCWLFAHRRRHFVGHRMCGSAYRSHQKSAQVYDRITRGIAADLVPVCTPHKGIATAPIAPAAELESGAGRS